MSEFLGRDHPRRQVTRYIGEHKGATPWDVVNTRNIKTASFAYQLWSMAAKMDLNESEIMTVMADVMTAIERRRACRRLVRLRYTR